jgi:phosphoglycerate dehydrogenase-like enzyme
LTTAAVILFCTAAQLAAQQKKIVLRAGEWRSWATSEGALRGFRQAAQGSNFVVAQSDEEFGREIADAEGIIGEITHDEFLKAKKLKWLQEYSAGVEDYGYKEFLDSDVILTNCKIVQGPTIADHAFGLLLALTRGLNRHVANREKEEWVRESTGLTELPGMTVVVIGVGGIGSQIAQRAHGFGMTVIGVDPKDIAPGNHVSRVVRPDQLDSVLPLADVVFVSAPHTKESEHRVGPRQFELMKQGAYFIAVSRGKLYDTPALVKALDSRKLAGAGLDVTDPEPLPKGHALWKFPNVIITPHIASQSPGAAARRVAVITENLRRYVAGEPLINVVEKRRGY